MDYSQKFNEASLPEEEEFYSHLNMDATADADYSLAKRVCEDIEVKNLREYHWCVCLKWYIIVNWCMWEF